MKKSLIFIMLIFIPMLTSCSNINKIPSNSNKDNSNSSNISSSPVFLNPSAVTKAELEKTYNDFTKLINSLNAEKIEKIEISSSFPELVPCTTTEKEIISQWVSLLKKMEITSKTFEPVNGLGYGMDVYCNGKQESIGGFMLPYIYTSSNRTMLYCENYDELKQEFEDLKNKIGYKPY